MGTECTAPRRTSGTLGLDRNALIWVAASFFCWFADAALTVGLGWSALSTLGATKAGIAVALSGTTRFVAGFFGGVLADARDPRVVMRAGSWGELLTLAIAAGLWSDRHQGAAIFTVAAAFGALAGLARPARTTWLRSLVDEDHMQNAVAGTQMASRVAQFTGAPAGAFIVTASGFNGTLLMATGGPLAVIAAITVIRTQRHVPRASHVTLRSALEGLTYLRRQHDARALVLGLSAANLCIAPLTAIGLAMIARQSHWGAGWVGYGEAIGAVCALAGSALAARLTAGLPARMSFMLLGVQGLAIPLVTSGTRFAYIAGLIIIGLCAGTASVHLASIYLATIDPEYLGRVGCWIGAVDLTLGPVVTPVWAESARATSLPMTGVIFGVASVVIAAVLTATAWRVNPSTTASPDLDR